MTMVKFSLLTIALLLMGWMSHWLIAVRKARRTAVATKTSLPDMWDYWTADWPTTWLSLIGLVVVYYIVPSLASRWPEIAVMIGATETDPLNPLAAYLGGLFAPWLADVAGARMAKMVGDPDVE